jgi:hypothetical protein
MVYAIRRARRRPAIRKIIPTVASRDTIFLWCFGRASSRVAEGEGERREERGE